MPGNKIAPRSRADLLLSIQKARKQHQRMQYARFLPWSQMSEEQRAEALGVLRPPPKEESK